MLDAAIAIIELDGAESLSMREVARRAGVSHQAPYHHFGDRSAIFSEIALQGFRKFTAAMSAPAHVDEDSNLVVRMCERYVEFALANKGHFRVMFRADLCHMDESPETQRAADDAFGTLLQAVGLRGALDLMPDELSGGMKRRVALARAIALDPQILMYDEPFVGQDPIAMGVLVRLIRLLSDALGITSIVVSHDLAETASIADYIYVVGDTQVLGQGTPDELMNSDNPRVRQFMQGIPDGPVPFHFPAANYRDDLLGGR